MARKDLERKRRTRRYRVRGCLYNIETILGAGFLIILFIVVEGVLITGGIRTLLQPNTVTCGDQTMSQEDACVDYSNGSVTSYAQAKQSGHIIGILELVASPLVLVGGIFAWRFFYPKYKSTKSSSPKSRRSQTNRPSQSGVSPSLSRPEPRPGASSSSSPPRQPEGGRRESS